MRRGGFALLSWFCLVGMSNAQEAATKSEPPTPEPDRKLPAVFAKSAPDSLDDMRAIEKQVKEVVAKVSAAVVGLKVGGNSEGSGVIISEDGYILTAAHVSGAPNKEIIVVMPDGKQYKAKSLGRNNTIDSGLAKITQDGKFPFVPIGKSSKVEKGNWVIVLGHPNGFKPGRQPVLRVGRVLQSTKELIQTDGTLVGGDSGGPLFDMQGRVIGIHSRIGQPIYENIHVPVDVYVDTWDRLVAAENWGGNPLAGNRPRLPFLGANLKLEENQVRVIDIESGSPADKGGLKVGDAITRFDGSKIASLEEFNRQLQKKQPEEEVSIEVQRGENTVLLKVTLGKPRRRAP
jgi:serine protease Do